MNGNDEIRRSVAETYEKAVKAPDKKGCGCGCGDATPKGVAAKLAGYSDEDLRGLPSDAIVNSFGCGNPLAFMEVSEGETVLDLGAGAGIDILLAARKVGPKGRAIGIDMTDEMIERARANIEASGLANAEIRKGLIEEMPVDDSSVDWVISNCVINLSPEKPRVFAEIARVLRPGGRMLVSDMVVEDMPSWLRGVQELYGSCISGAISEAEYVGGLEAAGLIDVEVRSRQVYDTAALEDFLLSETVPGAEEARKALAPMATDRLVRRAAKDLEGKLASIQVFARKPRS